MTTRTKFITGSIVALAVIVIGWFALMGFDTPPQDSIHVKGTVMSATADSLVVTTDTGKQATLLLTEDTRYENSEDLKPGDTIDAYLQPKTDAIDSYQVISISETSR